MNTKTPIGVEEYDLKIEQTVPYYSQFYCNTIDLVKTFAFQGAKWLDTGCGTGEMVSRALREFADYRFFLCDPSDEMIRTAQSKLVGETRIIDFAVCGSEQLEWKEEMDVVTAIQCHHYFKPDQRAEAVRRCWKALKPGGVFITFENIAPAHDRGIEIGLDRWGRYQQSRGKTTAAAAEHLARYGTEFFPITCSQHLELLNDCGFQDAELFWRSYVQAGFYAIKP